MFQKTIQLYNNIITPPITSHILKYSPIAKHIKQDLVKSELYGRDYLIPFVKSARRQIMLNKNNINNEDFYLGSVNDVLDCSRKNILYNNPTNEIKTFGLVFGGASLFPMAMLGDPTFFAIYGSIGVIGTFIIGRYELKWNDKYNRIIDAIYTDLQNKPLNLPKDKSLIYEQNIICDEMIEIEIRRRRASSSE